ncbi:MAG: hypothetical protein JW915_17225 [Chitinispirillaceae bacterium]|nr:hypothetical protein [Chitinispirillaceae bacterium]
MIKKYLLLNVILAVLFSLCLCQKKSPSNSSKSSEPSPQSASALIEEKKFIPPVDSLISEIQMKAWMKCNPLLDSLTFKYADSFKTKDPTLRLRYQEDFSKAQNKLCVLSGLPGGYKEYTWIMKNSGNPKNKPALDAAGAQAR